MVIRTCARKRAKGRRATFTLEEIKAQKARLENKMHSVAGETMHLARHESRFQPTTDKMKTSQAAGHLAHCRS